MSRGGCEPGVQLDFGTPCPLALLMPTPSAPPPSMVAFAWAPALLAGVSPAVPVLFVSPAQAPCDPEAVFGEYLLLTQPYSGTCGSLGVTGCEHHSVGRCCLGAAPPAALRLLHFLTVV